ncbi:hypothetical protein [Streptomyces yaizuensis]|uniref:Lipoprotein n=1 Tax=Streptomyces yaizuensis TaxID=2989713 RepID=A0ABQ5P1G8_9ACTN|nr:hypothetical protein [Streptomyces sp. YSPA8]GLF96051.1 hypothetical protein SYYSPA8_17160 [Streptomyces sp. YSPA8]
MRIRTFAGHRGHRSHRGSWAAAGLVAAAALVLTGCGGDDGGSGDDKKKEEKGQSAPADPGSEHSGHDSGDSSGSGSSSGSSSGSGGDGGDGGTGPVDSAAFQGQWAGKTDGTAVTVAITGTQVVMLADGASCSGEVADHGSQMLSMKCPGGQGSRTMGTIKSADGKQLVVDWGNGLTDNLAKAGLKPGDPAKLPSGLPSMKLEGAPAS